MLRLCFYWSEFTEALEICGDPDQAGILHHLSPHPRGGTVKITCCDASAMIKGC